MKIRNGFVSNSSSCSYCVIGEVIDEKKVWEGKLTYKDFNHSILMIGGFTDEGDAICELTYETYLTLINSIEIPVCKGQVMFVTNCGYYEGGEKLNKSHFESKDVRVFCGTRDTNSLESELEDSYIKGDGRVNF